MSLSSPACATVDHLDVLLLNDVSTPSGALVEPGPPFRFPAGLAGAGRNASPASRPAALFRARPVRAAIFETCPA